VCGAIGSTYNFASPHYQRLLKAFEAGDLAAARPAQLKAAELIGILGRYGFLAASKAVMSLVGVDCGPVRSPLRNLAREEIASLAEEVKALGVLG
jgi:N-acetylneuraminate lyase